MFRFDRRAYDQLDAATRAAIACEAVAYLEPIHTAEKSDVALAQMLGDACDLMFTFYAVNWNELARFEVALEKLALCDYLEASGSYVSILELGLYEATAKIHAALEERGLTRFSAPWNAAFDELLAEQREAPRNAGRLWAKIPPRPYVCFYPMDKKRGESVNWYALPYEERSALMAEHGKIGRTYHGLVTQVISGSIGFDDYEWGVDLYADDPLTFKRLIYEMRFDEASAKYAVFGPFYSGLQFPIQELGIFLEGSAPA